VYLLRRLLFFVSLAAAASASPITWSLSGVTSLGTTITGSFTYNADTNTFSSIDIMTVGGSVIPSETWTVESDTGASGTFLGLVDTSSSNQTGAHLLGLFFASPLTDLGGTVEIYETQQGTCSNATCSSFSVSNSGWNANNGWNTNVTGDVTASSPAPSSPAPEPSTLILTSAGVVLLIFRSRTRRA